MRWPDDRVEQLKHLLQRGPADYAAIGQVLGVSGDAVRSMTQRLGLVRSQGFDAQPGLERRLKLLPRFPDRGRCCWPEGKPVRFCNRPTPKVGLPYCKEHQKRAWTRGRDSDAKWSRR